MIAIFEDYSIGVLFIYIALVIKGLSLKSFYANDDVQYCKIYTRFTKRIY